MSKAPGLDGVPDLVVKEIATYRPEVLCEVFNKYFKQGTIPRTWKSVNLVLLQKGAKPLENPSSY